MPPAELRAAMVVGQCKAPESGCWMVLAKKPFELWKEIDPERIQVASLALPGASESLLLEFQFHPACP